MDCPFDVLQQIDAWEGTPTQFHAGVILAEPILGAEKTTRIRQSGNTPQNAMLVTTAVQMRRVKIVQQIERLRDRLAAHDSTNKAPLHSQNPSAKAQKKRHTRKEAE